MIDSLRFYGHCRCFVCGILLELCSKNLNKTGYRAEIKADGQMECFQRLHSCNDGQSGSQRRVLPHAACWVNWFCTNSSFWHGEFCLRAHHKSAPSAILIIAQINEVGELASVLRLCDVTNEVASVQRRTAGGHAPERRC